MPALNRALARPLRTIVWLGVSLGVLLAVRSEERRVGKECPV